MPAFEHNSTFSIGQFSDSYMPAMDGVVTVVRNYTYWLNKKHCDCFMAIPKTPGVEIREPFPVMPFISIPAYGRQPYRVGIPVMDIKYNIAIRRAHLDLVHAHSPFISGMEAMRLAKEREIPLVTTFHSKYYDDFLGFFGSEMLARQALLPIMRFYNKADYVWTVSNSTVDTLRDYGYRGPVDVIQNGTAISLPENPDEAREKAQALCGLGAQQPLLLFVGQHVLQKNTPMLIRAFAEYRRRGGVAKLAMVGQGYAREELEVLAKEHGVGESVVFLGQILDSELLNGLYLRASLFVFPSLYDNAPLVVREAAAMGCPSLMIEQSTAAEILTDGVNGFLCSNSVRSISERILQILDDPEKTRKAGEAARKTIVIPWEGIVDEVYARYEAIVKDFMPKWKRNSHNRHRLRVKRKRLRSLRRLARSKEGAWAQNPRRKNGRVRSN